MRAKYLIVAALILLANPAAADTKLVATFNSWSFYAHEEGQTPLCFAVGSPQSVEPAGARRDPAFFYISAWPRDGIRSEVSIKVGYPLRKGSEVTATIGSDIFKLFASDERAYVNDPFDELKLIEAMKKGSTMVVQATSERGTATNDTYTLSGVSRAVQSLTTNCN